MKDMKFRRWMVAALASCAVTAHVGAAEPLARFGVISDVQIGRAHV